MEVSFYSWDSLPTELKGLIVSLLGPLDFCTLSALFLSLMTVYSLILVLFVHLLAWKLISFCSPFGLGLSEDQLLEMCYQNRSFQ